MPTKGYRKGVSDAKIPKPRQIYTRVPMTLYDCISAEADGRSITVSELARVIMEAHAHRTRPELQHFRVNDPQIRELARLGNNVNQIAHRAHLDGLFRLEADARMCLGAIMAAVSRL